MFLNAFRIRLALMGAGILTLCVYLAMGGRLGPPRHGAITIEYGMYPDEFQGLAVEIDGVVAGTLKPFGSATRTAFEVKPGEHAIRVLHPQLGSQTRTLKVDAGEGELLILDFRDQVGTPGATTMAVGFQN
jgi:hypothetical protein